MEGLIRYHACMRPYKGKKLVLAAIIFVYVFIFAFGLQTYLHWQSVNLLLGIVSLWFCTRVNTSYTGGKRFGYIAAAFLLLLVFIPVKTMLYLAILSGVFYLVENYYGRLNVLPFFSVLLMSPFFQYLSNIFLFPIRIQLSQWAGWMLSLTGNKVDVSGNVISMYGQEFSVDPACMGLNMLVVSLLLCITLIGIYQKRKNVQLGWKFIVVLLLITLVLNIVSNLLRIILLVQFTILPGEVMHDITGILCLVLYVVLPMALLARWWVSALGKVSVGKMGRLKVSIIPHILLAAMHLLYAYKVNEPSALSTSFSFPGLSKGKYTVEQLKDDVVKLTNDRSLIYIKPISHFYNSDHSPMICWKGSGYELKRINLSNISGMQVYTATLQKEEDVLYTCWWYSNGQHNTTRQLEWRWNMLKGSAGYAIVNITAETPQAVELEVQNFHRQKASKK